MSNPHPRPSNGPWLFGPYKLNSKGVLFLTSEMDGDIQVALDERFKKVLLHFVRNAGAPVAKSDLIKIIWGSECKSTYAVRKYINQLYTFIYQIRSVLISNDPSNTIAKGVISVTPKSQNSCYVFTLPVVDLSDASGVSSPITKNKQEALPRVPPPSSIPVSLGPEVTSEIPEPPCTSEPQNPVDNDTEQSIRPVVTEDLLNTISDVITVYGQIIADSRKREQLLEQRIIELEGQLNFMDKWPLLRDKWSLPRNNGTSYRVQAA